VVLVDAVRTPFGKAGSLYAGTRADDLIVRAMRGLLERNPKIAPTDIDDVAIAAATQSGDQGMNIGRSATLLAGLPNSVPGYSIDRWCAGALTAMTTIAGSIAMGAYEVGIAGGVEHMGNHPMGEGMDPIRVTSQKKSLNKMHLLWETQQNVCTIAFQQLQKSALINMHSVLRKKQPRLMQQEQFRKI